MAYARKGRIVIEPFRPAGFGVGALIAAITDENRHDPVDIYTSRLASLIWRQATFLTRAISLTAIRHASRP